MKIGALSSQYSVIITVYRNTVNLLFSSSRKNLLLTGHAWSYHIYTLIWTGEKCSTIWKLNLNSIIIRITAPTGPTMSNTKMYFTYTYMDQFQQKNYSVTFKYNSIYRITNIISNCKKDCILFHYIVKQHVMHKWCLFHI